MNVKSGKLVLSRRAMLLGATAAGALLCLPVASAPATDAFERFMTVSRALTGVSDLDRSIGRTIFGLLGIAGRMDARATAVDKDLEVKIISAWHSGVVETPNGSTLATYSDALMWRSLDFTKPFGECSDGFGSWAAEPKARP